MKKRDPRVYLRQLQIMQSNGTHMKEMDALHEEEHICLNCKTSYVGNFCPHCGQKSNIKRLTFREAFENLIGIFTNFEKGFLHTCLDLCYRPGHMIRDYIKGHRVEYVKPVQLIFLLGTIYLAEHYLLFMEWMNSPTTHDDTLTEKYPELTNFMHHVIDYLDTPPILALMAILFLMLPNKFFFRKSPFGQNMNLAEHFYAMVFVGCQIFILAILIMPINFFIGYDSISITKYASVLIIWDFYQLMGFKFWKTVRQCLKSILLGFLLMLICVIIFASITVGLYVLISGDYDIFN